MDISMTRKTTNIIWCQVVKLHKFRILPHKVSAFMGAYIYIYIYIWCDKDSNMLGSKDFGSKDLGFMYLES